MKECFVIMPISDAEPYVKGHFHRVYDFIIKPSCQMAGFNPIRADQVANTNFIVLDIVKKIVESDMAICDLSSRNPNVLYELGIRQSFNRPVTIIRDKITPRVFDISGFRDIEYDENLRIDNVEEIISVIAQTLKNTYETAGEEINSLTDLLGIRAAAIDKKIEISNDTELILNSIAAINSRINSLEGKFFNINNISSISQNMEVAPGEQMSKIEIQSLKIGDKVLHQKFGKGTISGFEGPKHEPVALIDFDNELPKKIMLNYAKFLRTD